MPEHRADRDNAESHLTPACRTGAMRGAESDPCPPVKLSTYRAPMDRVGNLPEHVGRETAAIEPVQGQINMGTSDALCRNTMFIHGLQD